MMFGYLFGHVAMYYLVHWVEEEKVSIHEASQVTLNSKENGFCIGRKCYNARKIAGNGTKAAMLSLEKAFIDGKTEFNYTCDENIQPCDALPQIEVLKGNEKELIKGRKRKLVTDGGKKLSTVKKSKTTAPEVKKSKLTAKKSTKDQKKSKKTGSASKKRGSIIVVGSGKESEESDQDSSENEDDANLLQNVSQKKLHAGTTSSNCDDHEFNYDDWDYDFTSDGQELTHDQDFTSDQTRVQDFTHNQGFTNHEFTHKQNSEEQQQYKEEIKDLANRVVKMDHHLQMLDSKLNYLFHLSASSGLNADNMTSWTSPHVSPLVLSNRSSPVSNDDTPSGSCSGAISKDNTTDTPSSSCSGAARSFIEPLLNNKASAFLKRLAVQKEEKPLPPINKIQLQQPETVVEKYPKLLNITKIPTLSVRLAKESFFGKEIMKLCTVRGTGSLHPLPVAELTQLK
ncbi:uncharacterized protein [Dysidea avara]|uniref:uncharacterized protein isoform X3 n=1 Tax=Dysidea avara TaxID=196820 RepID=UPI00332173B9